MINNEKKYIKELVLSNSSSEHILQFLPGVNVIIGTKGGGKSTLLKSCMAYMRIIPIMIAISIRSLKLLVLMLISLFIQMVILNVEGIKEPNTQKKNRETISLFKMTRLKKN
ncbi:unique hypothetical domain protein [Mycoplasmoides gallisepticum str. R(low)]|uniref:Unique hypothetical domain protein n=1 Tax=Mycoplasmoides gallisepticum (strain R(low / passage 15 / clone 2)) TaxID=710127 RepID=D3DEJ0_MYCGA|nr:unique hypothetical domain protein [Mycoplasmoides gallisepticum str. R(low)]ADC30469.1 hypothetical domain protein [Mycoplasmoides gallisepticum str. R(high)]